MKPILKNEEGFTLLEALISLLISSFVILLLTGSLLNVVSIRDTMTRNAQMSDKSNIITGDRQVEWHIFLNQLENYLQGTYEPTVHKNDIQVKEIADNKGGFKESTYRIDGTNQTRFSRRTSNGYHRMLTDIEQLEFVQDGGWLNVAVIFLNGDIFSGRIWIESWVEKLEDLEEEDEEPPKERMLEDEEKDDKKE